MMQEGVKTIQSTGQAPTAAEGSGFARLRPLRVWLGRDTTLPYLTLLSSAPLLLA